MPAHREEWTGQDGRTYSVQVHPEKKGSGDCKVYTVTDSKGNELGHITWHANGTVNRHGIFVDKDLKPPQNSMMSNK